LKSFDRFVVDLCAIATIKAVSSLLGVGWDLVKGIFKEELRTRLKKRRLSEVRYIAVDEFSLHRGAPLHVESGHILYVAEGKDAAALIPFLKSRRRRRVHLKAVAMDMSAACKSSKGFGQISSKNKRGFQVPNTFFRLGKQPLMSDYM